MCNLGPSPSSSHHFATQTLSLLCFEKSLWKVRDLDGSYRTVSLLCCFSVDFRHGFVPQVGFSPRLFLLLGFSFPRTYFAPSHVAQQRALSLLKLGFTQWALPGKQDRPEVFLVFFVFTGIQLFFFVSFPRSAQQPMLSMFSTAASTSLVSGSAQSLLVLASLSVPTTFA